MNRNTPAELRFPDEGITAYGILACVNGKTMTVRLVEKLGSDLFAYGKAAVLVYPDVGGVHSAPCRLVAEYDAGISRDFVVVLTGQPTVTERRREARIPCHLDAAYRAMHGGQAYGAWSHATVVDLSRDGMALLVTGRPEFPDTVEIRITIPETLTIGREPSKPPVALIRNGSPASPEGARPIRLRAEMRHRRHSGLDAVIGLKFLAIPSPVEERIVQLLQHLTAMPVPQREHPAESPARPFTELPHSQRPLAAAPVACGGETLDFVLDSMDDIPTSADGSTQTERDGDYAIACASSVAPTQWWLPQTK